MITCLNDLAEVFGVTPSDPETTQEQIKSSLYKYTGCGASIEFTSDGVKLGTIVEGWDSGYIECGKLKYPFEERDLDYDIEYLEESSHNIWNVVNNTHFCIYCGEFHGLEDEVDEDNPVCPKCGETMQPTEEMDISYYL